MSRSKPSLLALLGLVAVAGYQHKDKLSEVFANLRGPRDPDRPASESGFLDELSGMFQSGKGLLSGGLGELVDRFRDGGRGASAESWVSDGDNAPVEERDLEDVLGEETIAELTAKTGLTRGDLLKRLSTSLPDVVNQMTPRGRLPTEEEEDELQRTESGAVVLNEPARGA